MLAAILEDQDVSLHRQTKEVVHTGCLGKYPIEHSGVWLPHDPTPTGFLHAEGDGGYGNRGVVD